MYLLSLLQLSRLHYLLMDFLSLSKASISLLYSISIKRLDLTRVESYRAVTNAVSRWAEILGMVLANALLTNGSA